MPSLQKEDDKRSALPTAKQNEKLSARGPSPPHVDAEEAKLDDGAAQLVFRKEVCHIVTRATVQKLCLSMWYKDDAGDVDDVNEAEIEEDADNEELEIQIVYNNSL